MAITGAIRYCRPLRLVGVEEIEGQRVAVGRTRGCVTLRQSGAIPKHGAVASSPRL